MHIGWDDLQTLEALVRTRSVEFAGRELGLRHSSVSRRVAALERRLGEALFVRGPRLTPTPLALRIAERATVMRAGAIAIDELVTADRRHREDRIVVTTSDVLAPLVCSVLARAALATRVELLVSDEELDLQPGRVDLALRPSQDPRGSLRGRRLGWLRVGVYRSRVGADAWVLPDARLRAKTSMRWWRHVPEGGPGTITCSSLLTMRDACRVGLGRAALPSSLAYEDDRLLLEREVDGGPPLWLLTTSASPVDAKVRAARDALATTIRGFEGVLLA